MEKTIYIFGTAARPGLTGETLKDRMHKYSCTLSRQIKSRKGKTVKEVSAAGFWKGVPESSYITTVKTKEAKEAKEAGAVTGRLFGQDGVALFEKDRNGGDLLLFFSCEEKEENTAARLSEYLDAFSIVNGHAVFISNDPIEVNLFENVANESGAKVKALRGNMSLVYFATS